ncbi:A/G-specific adenine glycosylase [Candidatus Uhrbacteria bacterium]|nr:A/G-specific adenine glycosylase [Candidatus Uhrbacteria bacterium]
MRPVVRLMRWFKKHGRDLPWRHTHDPYRILVSEVMLQQTQVSRAIVFYSAWLTHFSDWKTLAAASNGEVLRQWTGLGYNRRALQLRDAARFIVQHGVPMHESEWRAIKGIGVYTAAAVTAFAMRQPTLPVDTNIRRVGGRLWLKKPFATCHDDNRIRRAGVRFIDGAKDACDVPQALFDLATMHCTKVPECALCPMRSVCPMAERFLQQAVRIPKRVTTSAAERIQKGKRYPDRIYRGRILQLLQKEGATSLQKIGTQIDPRFSKRDHVWLQEMINRLVKDGMARREKNQVTFVE